MAITVHQIRPVAHFPLILGVVRKLDIATIIDGLIPPNPANVLSCGLTITHNFRELRERPKGQIVDNNSTVVFCHFWR